MINRQSLSILRDGEFGRRLGIVAVKRRQVSYRLGVFCRARVLLIESHLVLIILFSLIVILQIAIQVSQLVVALPDLSLIVSTTVLAHVQGVLVEQDRSMALIKLQKSVTQSIRQVITVSRTL